MYSVIMVSYHIYREFSLDIMTYQSRENTGGTNNINYASVPCMCASMSGQWDSMYNTRTDTGTPEWNIVVINVISALTSHTSLDSYFASMCALKHRLGWWLYLKYMFPNFLCNCLGVKNRTFIPSWPHNYQHSNQHVLSHTCVPYRFVVPNLRIWTPQGVTRWLTG